MGRSNKTWRAAIRPSDSPEAAPVESRPTGGCTAGSGFPEGFLTGAREVLEAGMSWERAFAMLMGFMVVAERVEREELETKTVGVLRAMKGDIDHQAARAELEARARKSRDEARKEEDRIRKMKASVEAYRGRLESQPKKPNKTGESR